MGSQQIPTMADELLAEAASRSSVSRVHTGWLGRLAPEHLDAVEAARDKWIAGGGKTGPITAKALAVTIVEAMTRLGYRMPNVDGVSKWLTGKR